MTHGKMLRKGALVRIGKNKRVYRVAKVAKPGVEQRYYLEADAEHPDAAKRLADAFRWYSADELTRVI